MPPPPPPNAIIPGSSTLCCWPPPPPPVHWHRQVHGAQKLQCRHTDEEEVSQKAAPDSEGESQSQAPPKPEAHRYTSAKGHRRQSRSRAVSPA
jgi:hypothetical protein